MEVETGGKDGEKEEEGEGEGKGGKVSTSGPRMSRREQYKTTKNFQVRLTPKTHFRGSFPFFHSMIFHQVD